MRTRFVAPRIVLVLAILVPCAGIVSAHGKDIPETLQEAEHALYRADYDHAAALAQGYLRDHPQALAAQILLARVEIAQGHYEPALEALEMVLKHDPADPDVLYYLEWLSRLMSQMEFRHLFQVAPDSARAHQIKGEAYESQSMLDLAEGEYVAALKTDPQRLDVLDALGDLKRRQFRFDEAIDYYSRAREEEPDDYTSTYGLGAAYLLKRDLPRAVRLLKLAAAIEPETPAARLALGDALLQAGHADAAVGELDAAVSLAPDMRQAYVLLARAYRILGRTEDANAALRRSQELNTEEIELREKPLGSEERPQR